MPRGGSTFWPEAREDLCQALIAAGHSSAKIAQTLGVSRDAVLGKIRRKGWSLARSRRRLEKSA